MEFEVSLVAALLLGAVTFSQLVAGCAVVKLALVEKESKHILVGSEALAFASEALDFGSMADIGLSDIKRMSH